ncbi:hypothetical protein ANCCAN_29068 [Ancylostoma caninum]|uniref:Uncharacterized protein n=1 Tax=Ancylostoma caninum TaxID=29170 RepID=A0A368EZG6_ANCCA|nr:hypothetical protein ANCCAN_29068 [Ancylostoma caninum]
MYYITARLSFTFFGFLRRLLHVSLIIERCIATIRLSRYEKQSARLGQLLLVISVSSQFESVKFMPTAMKTANFVVNAKYTTAKTLNIYLIQTGHEFS